jgi:tRNA modification GTPase
MLDTIVALATPYGRSGIGVIRLSGKNSLKIVRKLVRDECFSPEPRFAALKKIYDLETADILDETIITYFQSPQSFTGEDVIEISCHGSPIVLRQIIDFALKLDARMAEAGEFSLRALSNGRINLSQAEAIRDLIDAQSIASAKQSVRQLHGELSNQLQPLKDDLLEVIVVLESSLEFVEDDLPYFQVETIKRKLLKITEDLGKMASTFQSGKLLREGLKVALVGRPNVGKSSLFNALLGQERAIVTEIAGTTRDHLYEKFTINNIPVSLIDTAGLRETSDIVESLGVERSKRVMFDADLVVVLLDGSEKFTSEDEKIVNQIKELNHLVVINKTDLKEVGGNSFDDFKMVKISAKTGEGLDNLQKAIIEPFLSQNLEGASFLISDARHNDLLLRAKLEIEDSCHLIDIKTSEEIILVGLHNALQFLGKITGEITTEDMLNEIFSTFCIGK